MRNLFFLLIIILFINCDSKKLFIKNSEVKSSMYLFYCNDSLGLYSQFYGDFNQKEFLKNPLFKSDKYILRKTGFIKKQDRILFHSFTTLDPIYNVIGVLRSNFDRTKYEENLNNHITVYNRIYFGKYNAYEVLYPVKEKFLSIIFYEKNFTGENKLKNILDYQKMRDFTLEALEKKHCGKENILNLANEAFNEDKQGNYLAYKRIKQVESNYINTNEENFYRQILSTYLSFAQENEDAENEFNKLQKKNINNDFKKNFKSVPTNTETLIDSIKSKQIVIFNESHNIPKHRYLVGSLLKPLYDAGFKYFGLEAFFDEAQLNNTGFPTLSNGFYVREQTMGNLIREAKKIGFKVFEYDSQNKNRESDQASNIYDKTLKNDKNAKVLILCGYSHIDEKDGWMAEHLYLKFNINPYTVNQTSYSYYDAANQLEIVSPNNQNFKSDLFINNNVQINNNCFGLRVSKEIEINFPINKTNNNVILVYNKNEFDNVENPIPVFVKTLEKNQSNLKLSLCTGNYKIIIKSIQGIIKFENLKTVN